MPPRARSTRRCPRRSPGSTIAILASKKVVAQTKPELLALVTAAESTHDAIEAIAGVIAEQRRTLDHLSGTLLETLTDRARQGGCARRRWSMRRSAAPTASPRKPRRAWSMRSCACATPPRPPPTSARETLAHVIPEAAGALEAASAEAMRRATTDTVERQVRAIADATDVAVDAATRATERLSGQVQAIARADRLASIPGSRRPEPSARSTTATPSRAASRC